MLARLPAPWVVVNDLRWPGRQRANIDHVVIGPGGAFVVDSKAWSGDITINEDIRQNGRRRDLATAAQDAATAVHEQLLVDLAQVIGVVCFVRDEAIAGAINEVLVCSTFNLVHMLQSRPEVLTEQQVARAADALRGSPYVGLANAVTADPRAAAPVVPPAPPVGRGRRVRRSKSRRGLKTVVAVCLILGLLGFIRGHLQGLSSGNGSGTAHRRCPRSATVKATTTAAGQKIYRLPRWTHYVAMEPDRCFTTSSRAAAAGYHPARHATRPRTAKRP